MTGVSAATSTSDITEPDPPATIAGPPSEKATSAGKPRRDKKPKKSSVDSAYTPASSVASSSKLPVVPAPMSPPKKKRKKDKKNKQAVAAAAEAEAEGEGAADADAMVVDEALGVYRNVIILRPPF